MKVWLLYSLPFFIHTIQFSGPLHEKSYFFALHIVIFATKIAKDKKEFVLSRQITRSATSVGANIEEAQQPQSRPDFISKLSIALKEAYESRYWLHLLRDAGFAEKIETDLLLVEVTEVISMLIRSIKTAKQGP
jgi:four helix bundle protein